MKLIKFVLPAILLFISCGQKGETPKPAEVTSNTIEIKDGWVRPGKAGRMTAAFFKIENGTTVNDSLLSIESDVTDDTQIHESYEMEGGMMGMRPAGLIPVGAGEVVELKPGGLHIMIIQPFEDVPEGDSVHFTLTFSEFGDKEITLPVKPMQGGGMMNH